ncbi:uncharacterized protein LOC108949721 isoform X2 [Ciona intestinalis]
MTCCHVIIVPLHVYNFDQIPEVFFTNYAWLQAAVNHFQSSVVNFKLSVLCCYEMECFAKTLENLCKKAKLSSFVDEQSDLSDRSWLHPSANESELFLINIPAINAFNAQLMLKYFNVQQICNMNMEELSNNFPWIPNRILKDIWMSLNSKLTSSMTMRCEEVMNLTQYKPDFNQTRDIPHKPPVSLKKRRFSVNGETSENCSQYLQNLGVPPANYGRDINATPSSGSSGSLHVGIARPFQQAHNLFKQDIQEVSNCKRFSQTAIMTPHAKRKMLTYERVPGSKGGQTRLTFY